MQFLPKLKIVLHSDVFLLSLIIISFLYTLFFIFIIPHQSLYSQNTNVFEGKIINKKIINNKVTLTIKGKEKIIASTYYNSEKELSNYQKLKLGMTIKIWGKLEKPNANSIPNTFNYQKYLKYQKIYYLMNIQSFKITNNSINLFYQFKNKLIAYLDTKDYKEYYFAFILGDKSFIDKDIYTSFQNNGITHLFALSGMHIALFIFLLTKLFKILSINKIFTNIFIFTFLIFYLVLTNFTASILRALGFYFFLKINKALKLNLSSIKVLIYTLIFLLLINPFLIFNLGFLYSALATIGLILTSSYLKSKNYFSKIFMTSLMANLFTLPITLLNFYEINLLSLFLNIIFVPFVSFIIYPLILITLFLPFNFLITLFLKLMEILSTYLSLIKLNIIFPKINFIFIFIYYFLLYLILIKHHFKLISLLLILFISQKLTPYFDNSDYFYFLDVNQGDSILIKTKYQEVILVDTGGIVSYGEFKSNYHLSDTTITFLKSLGITKIDYLILTHGDYDHMGEGINLINKFKIKKVIFNWGKFNELEQDLIKELDKKKIPYYHYIKQLNLKNNKLYFLNNKIYNNENDNSNIIYTKFNYYKFLLMGDASIEVEEDLLEKYNLKNIDVLKVGHHGSKTSSSQKFINKINPQYAIISVGENNRYGHPNQEVLENLKKTKIYRTDQKGTIMFKIKENKLKIENYSK